VIIDCGSNDAPQQIMLQAFFDDDVRKSSPHEPPWYVQIHGFGDDPTGFPMLEGWLVHVDECDVAIAETAGNGSILHPVEGWEHGVTETTTIDLSDIAVFRIP
jgi:hypothetical protein